MGWRGQVEKKVGGATEFVDINISPLYSLSQSSNVIHAKESNWSPPCHWLLETAEAAPKLCCLLGDFNQTCLCYLGFLCWQQNFPSGSISFNRFYWPISSVCSVRKPGQFFKVYRHSKNFNNCFFFPNLFPHFFSVCYVGCRGWTRSVALKFLKL